MRRKAEEWRDIPGYDGWYQISNAGRIRTWHSRNGRGRSKEPHIKKAHSNCGSMEVTLRGPAVGQQRNHSVASLVFRAFIGDIPPGMKVCHKSLDTSDNRPENLVLSDGSLTARQANIKRGGKYAVSNRKPVVKMDTDLNVVAVYSSACRAEKLNFFGNGSLTDYCNQKRASVIAGDGYIYAWDDEKCLRKTLTRAMQELDALGIRYTYHGTAEYWNLPLEAGTEPPDLWLEAASLVGGGSFGRIMRIGA